METAVRTPLEIFNLPQHLVVPLFQRPYVWNEEAQWQPLWQDIRRLAELRLADPSATASHFLGAVVLQASENQAGTLQPRAIIDGQQRLTTLQLLLDATSAVFETMDLAQLSGQLEALTHNASHFIRDPDDALKLRHTNRDRLAFDEVMNADPPVRYDDLSSATSLIAGAHRYFAEQVADWLGNGAHASARAEALAAVITRGLQLVVIDLRLEENSQEIFETLNARGTPLTAADLIKNFVFQRLAAEGVDTARAYAELWPFDTATWERSISVGRFLVSRSSLFLNQWLISRVAEEIGPSSTFSRFKYFVEHEAIEPMSSLLAQIQAQAGTYETWTQHAADPNAALTRTELCVYRSQAADSEALKPLLIWLHSPSNQLDAATIDDAVQAAESWLMRRSLLRLTMADAGRIIAELLRLLHGVAAEAVPDRVNGYFARLNAESTYWPGDAEIKQRLVEEPVYRRFKRGRLRMFLEAAEDYLRGYTSGRPSLTGARVARTGWHIEHLLPRKWDENWPVEGPIAQAVREAHVHRLGNLTLLTGSLNSRVSNGPWLGEKGKLTQLASHDVFLLNRRIRDVSVDGWTEALIDARTDELTDALIATWPVPPGHIGEPDNRAALDTSNVSLKDLVTSGLVPAGTVLTSTSVVGARPECEVLSTGDLLLDGQRFSSPSAAGHHVRHGATNGWWFWHLPDGRRLKDARADFLSANIPPTALVNPDPASVDRDWIRSQLALGLTPDQLARDQRHVWLAAIEEEAHLAGEFAAFPATPAAVVELRDGPGLRWERIAVRVFGDPRRGSDVQNLYDQAKGNGASRRSYTGRGRRFPDMES